MDGISFNGTAIGFIPNYYQKNPSIDGFMVDNVFHQPRVNADWNRDGKTDSQSDAQVGTWYRQGYQQYFNTMKSLIQENIIGEFGSTNSGRKPEYNQLLNGGFLEGMIGYSWSYETWAAFLK